MLDLLTSQMAQATTLHQMREARDNLLTGAPLPKQLLGPDTMIDKLDAGGVELEVVRAPSARGGAAAVLLVHGGLFMSGSPTAVRHLAARLSADVGVPVVTPRLRLAPEFPFPAALVRLQPSAHDRR